MSVPTTAPTDPDGPAVFTHRQILVIMSGLMLGMFLAALDQTIVSTALPTIVGDFHRSDLLSWVVTAYLLASTASTPLWGKAGDLYGRAVRRVAEHVRADRFPRNAGHRRRRPAGAGVRDHW
jgi:MFS family permease